MFKKRIISLAMALLVLLVTSLTAAALPATETNYLSAEVTQDGVMTIRGNLYGEWLGANVSLIIMKPVAAGMSLQEIKGVLDNPNYVEHIAQTTTNSYGKFVYTHTLEDTSDIGDYTVMMSYRNTQTLEADRTVVCNYDPIEGLFANAHINTDGMVTVFGYAPRMGVSSLNISVKRIENADGEATTEALVFNDKVSVVNDEFVFQRKLNDVSLTGVHKISVSDDDLTEQAVIKANYFGSETTHPKTHPETHPLQLFVSPDAHYFGAGTEADPFYSLQHAVEMIEKLNINEDINVYLREGNHYLTSTVELNADNTLSDGKKLTFTSYPGERATIHGGKTITGWKDNGDGKYYADVELSDFRELYVNGELATRARTENTYQGLAWYNTSGKYFNDASHYPDYEGSPVEVAPDALHRHNMENKGGTTANTYGFRGGLAVPDSGELSNIAKWGNQEDIEIIDNNKTYKHLRIMATDVITKKTPDVIGRDNSTTSLSGDVPILVFNAESSYAATDNMPNYPWCYDSPFYMENAYELLDNAGEWYYDNDADRLYYMPEAGVDMDTAVIEVPQVEKLITITGTTSQKVSNVIFKDLDIGYSTWRSVNEIGAYAAMQAGQTLVHEQDSYAGAIVLNYTDSIDFIGCNIKNIGSAGIVLKEGAIHTDITDNEIYNIGASSVVIGTTSHNEIDADGEELCTDTNILRNHIHNVANQYTSNTGIWGVYTARLNISNNEIHDMPYTGVSVGWGWNSYSGSTTCRENTISYNYIYDVMLTQCYDGAPVYTLGNQPGTKIHHNYLYINNPLGHGIYLDEGSNYIEVTENVVNITDTALNDPDYSSTDWLRITYLRLPGDTTEAIPQECIVERNYSTTNVNGIDNNLNLYEDKVWDEYLLNNNTFGSNIMAMDEVKAIVADAGIHGVYIAGGAVMNNPGTDNSTFLTTDGNSDTVAYFRIKNYDATDITADRRLVVYEGKRMKSNAVKTVTIEGNSDEWYEIAVDTSFYNSNTLTGAPRYKVFFWEVFANVNEYLPLLKSIQLYN